MGRPVDPLAGSLWYLESFGRPASSRKTGDSALSPGSSIALEAHRQLLQGVAVGVQRAKSPKLSRPEKDGRSRMIAA